MGCFPLRRVNEDIQGRYFMKNITVIQRNGKASEVEYKDDSGKLKRVIIPTDGILNNTAGDDAIEYGIETVIDIDKLNWDKISIELNNELIGRDLTTITSIQQRQSEFNSTVLAIVGKPLLTLFKEKEGA